MTNLQEFFQERIVQHEPCPSVGFLTELRQCLIEIHNAVFALDFLLKNRPDINKDAFIFGNDLYELRKHLNILWSEFVLIANQLSDFSRAVCFISLEEQANSGELTARFDLNDIVEYINYVPRIDPTFCEVVLILDRAETIIELCNSYWEPYIHTNTYNEFLQSVGAMIGFSTTLLRRSLNNLAIYRKAILLRDLLLAIFDLPNPTTEMDLGFVAQPGVFQGIESNYELMLSLVSSLMTMNDDEIIGLHKLFYESVQDDVASSSSTSVLCGLLILLWGLKTGVQKGIYSKSIIKYFLEVCKEHLSAETYKVLVEHSKLEDIKALPEPIDIKRHVNNLYFDLVENLGDSMPDAVKDLAATVKSIKSIPIKRVRSRSKQSRSSKGKK